MLELRRGALWSLALIAIVIGIASAAFAYTAGWLSPDRLTPGKLVAAFAPPGGPALGHRRNHAKGICFTGVFEANGAGSELSRRPGFRARAVPGARAVQPRDRRCERAGCDGPGAGPGNKYLDTGRTGMAERHDRSADVSGLDAARLLRTAARVREQGPECDEDIRRGPSGVRGVRRLGQDRALAPQLRGRAVQQPQQLRLHRQVRARSMSCAGRCCRRPQPVAISPEELAKLGPDFLEQEIAQRVAAAPQRWTMVVTVANPGDPTADPTKRWPDDRRNIEVGTLIAHQVEAERDGPCRDINFDPTVLPSGMQISDDPFPAARSAAYARSYDLRTAEAKDYPRTVTGGKS